MFGKKKLEANCLLESGMKLLCAGFSNESYSVPVLYCVNCWANIFEVSNKQQKKSSDLFIDSICVKYMLQSLFITWQGAILF